MYLRVDKQQFEKLKPFDPTRIDSGERNCKRAERAERVIEDYKHGELNESGPAGEQDVVDLLTDCLHWLHREGCPHLDFYSVLSLACEAHGHFIAETNGEPDGIPEMVDLCLLYPGVQSKG